MSCDAIKDALTPFLQCEDTVDGARVLTHCLYPSFEPVTVFVVKLGEGFRVHDGGGAERASWLHGREASLITKMINRQANRYHLTIREGALTADVPDVSWLMSAILSVANASAAAANAVIERVAVAAELDLIERVFGVLSLRFGERNVKRRVPVVGRSGKQYEFDFSVPRIDRSPILIDTVVPHHASVAHKFMAFSDVAPDPSVPQADTDAPERWAVYDKELEPDDASLMRRVAALVPFASLTGVIGRVVNIAPPTQ